MSDALVVKRKAKRTGLLKQVRKYSNALIGYALPTLRYSLVPGLLLYSMFYTEPQPSFSDLVNPFF